MLRIQTNSTGIIARDRNQRHKNHSHDKKKVQKKRPRGKPASLLSATVQPWELTRIKKKLHHKQLEQKQNKCAENSVTSYLVCATSCTMASPTLPPVLLQISNHPAQSPSFWHVNKASVCHATKSEIEATRLPRTTTRKERDGNDRNEDSFGQRSSHCSSQFLPVKHFPSCSGSSERLPAL